MKLFGSSGGKWTKKDGQENAAPDTRVQEDWDIDELLSGTKQESYVLPADEAEIPARMPEQPRPAERPARMPEQPRPAERPARMPEQPRPAERPVRMPEQSRSTERSVRMPEQQRRPAIVADEGPRRSQEEYPEVRKIPGRENAWGKGILLIMSSFLLLLLAIYAVGAELTLWI